MTFAGRYAAIVSRWGIANAYDVDVTPGASLDNYPMTWDNGTSKFVLDGTLNADNLTLTEKVFAATNYNTSPLFVVGNGLGLDYDGGAAILVDTVQSGSVGDVGHAFVASDSIDISGSWSYASFDARIIVSGSNSYNHFAGYQYRPRINTSGTTGISYGFQTAPEINTGEVTTQFHYYAQNPTGTGTIVNDFGLYIDNLTKATNNWSIYTGTAKSFFGGNVGFGVLNPAVRVEVDGNLKMGANNQIQFTGSGGSTSAIRNVGTVDLTFRTNGGDRVIIDGSGYLGIGTVTPGTMVHALLTSAATNAITNVLTIGHDTSGTAAAGLGAGILFKAESDTTAAQDQAQIASLWTTATHATRASALTFSTITAGGSLTERVRITGAGDIGIGTTTPTVKLDVNGAIRAGNNNQLQLPGSDGTASSIRNVGLTDLTFRTNSGDRAIIDGNGYLGIGTAAPASRLDIAGGALTMLEMVAPSAPAANSVVIYAVDNGAGKTQLMALFASGVAQQIAIEP